MKIKNWILAFAASLPLALVVGFSNAAMADWTDCSTAGVDNHVDGQTDCTAYVGAPGDQFNDEGGSPNINDFDGDAADDNGDGNADFDPLFGGSEAWMELGVSPDEDPVMYILNPDYSINNDEGNGLLTGGFAIDASVFDMYGEVMLFFKDGQFGSTGVLIDPTGFYDVDGPVSTTFGPDGVGLALFEVGGPYGGCNFGSGPVDCYLGDFAYVIPPGGEQGAISHINLYVRDGMDVAEPGTLALFGLGLLGLGLSRRRKLV